MNKTLVMCLITLLLYVGICVFIYIRDRREKEPVWLLVTLFSLSSLVYYPVHLFGNNVVNPLISRMFSGSYTMDPLNGIQWESSGAMILHAYLCALIGVGLLEELACWLVLYLLTSRNRNFNCTWDGVVYSVCVAMGASFSKSCLFALTLGGDQFIIRYLRSLPWDLALGILMGTLYTYWFTEKRADAIENSLLKKRILKKNILHYPVFSLAVSILFPIIMRASQNVALEQSGLLKADFETAMIIISVALFIICFVSIIIMSRRDRTLREAVEDIIENGHGDLPDRIVRDFRLFPGKAYRRENRFEKFIAPAVLSAAVIGIAVFACSRVPAALAKEENVVPEPDRTTGVTTTGADSGELPADTSDAGAETGEASSDPSEYIPAVPENCYTFYYDSLGEKEREIYDAVYRTMKNGKETVELAGVSKDDRQLIKDTVATVGFDHPELVQYDGKIYYATYYPDSVKLRFVKYDFWTGTVLLGRYMELMEDRVALIVGGAERECADDYEKVKYVHDCLVNGAVYDVAALDEILANPTGYSSELDLVYTAFGCLVNGRCVCAGYAKAFKLIMDRLCIPCVYVIGWGTPDPSEDDVGHAWNRVVIDGESYYVDVTWDSYSACLSESGELLYPGAISYRYLNVTTEDLEKTHTVNENYAAQPACTATKYNYYVQSGYLLEKYDAEAFKEMIRQQASLQSVNIRITDLSSLETAKKDYFAAASKLLDWPYKGLFIFGETGHIDIVKKNPG